MFYLCFKILIFIKNISSSGHTTGCSNECSSATQQWEELEDGRENALTYRQEQVIRRGRRRRCIGIINLGLVEEQCGRTGWIEHSADFLQSVCYVCHAWYGRDKTGFAADTGNLFCSYTQLPTLRRSVHIFGSLWWGKNEIWYSNVPAIFYRLLYWRHCER